MFMLLAGGYDNFLSGRWSTMWFFLTYAMIGFFIAAFVFWKLVFKSSYIRSGAADLSLGGLKEEIDEYEANFIPRAHGSLGNVISKMFE